MVDIIAAKHVRDFTLWLRFGDGAEGEVDLTADVAMDADAFKDFNVQLGTLAWPNGAGVPPERLYARVAEHQLSF